MTRLSPPTIERNIQLLSREWPEIAHRLQTESSTDTVQLIPAKDGFLACRLSDSKQQVWIHSDRAPRQETLSPLRDFQPGEGELVIVWQSGLGYLASELCTLRANGPNWFRLIVVESRTTVFRASLQVTNYDGLLNSRSTYLLVGSDAEDRLLSLLKRFPWLLKNRVTVLPGSIPSTSFSSIRNSQFVIRNSSPSTLSTLEHIRTVVQELQDRSKEELTFLHTRLSPEASSHRVVVSAGLYPAHAQRLCEAFHCLGWEVVQRMEPSSLTRFVEDPDSFLDVCRDGFPGLVLSFGGKSDLSLEDLRQLRSRGVTVAAWFYDNPFRFPLPDEELSQLDEAFVFDRYYESFFRERGIRACATLPAAFGISPPPAPPPDSYLEEISFLGSTGIDRIVRFSHDLPPDDREVTNLSRETITRLLEMSSLELREEMERLAGYDGSDLSRLRLLVLEEFLSYRIRIRYLTGIADLPLGIYGDTNWGNPKAVGNLTSCYRGKGTRFPDETIELYRTSKINVNIFHAQCIDSVTTRVYDTLAAGGFLLSEYRPILEREFEIGKEFEIFHTPDELREKALHYLQNEKKREQIAQQGREKVLHSASYENRVFRLLEILKDRIGKRAES